MIRTLKLAISLALLFGLHGSAAMADEIIFSGGAGGLVAVTDNTITGAHEFVLFNGPLDTLVINGTFVAFSGVLNIDATGNTMDNSGDLIFDSGTLTIASGGNTEVSANLLGAALGILNGLPSFVGVLDPTSTTFGDLLAAEGPLVAGLGGTQFEIVLPVINPPSIGFLGETVNSGAILETPEPSALVLLGAGLLGLLLKKSLN